MTKPDVRSAIALLVSITMGCSTAPEGGSARTAAVPDAPLLASRAVTMHHNDLGRTGAYLAETSLSPASLTRYGMRLVRSLPLDGTVGAQPLYVPGNVVAGVARDVVYVATRTGWLYAYDANDGTSLPGWPVRFADFEDATKRHVPSGILSTPVIDPEAGLIYAVFGAFDQKDADNVPGDMAYWLVAVDLVSGVAARHVRIAGQFQARTFDARTVQNRPALLLSQGSVYVAFGALNEGPRTTRPDQNYRYSGWMLRYDASTLAPLGAFCTTPNNPQQDAHKKTGQGGGIWQSGGGPVADENGSVYFLTGNGSNTLDPSPTAPNQNPLKADGPTPDLGDSFVKLTPTSTGLAYAGAFWPADLNPGPGSEDKLDGWDIDLGSGGALLIPGSHRIVGAGKTGILYNVDRDAMSASESFQAFANDYPIDYSGAPYPAQPVDGGWMMLDPHLHGSLAFWQGTNMVYGWSEADRLKAYRFDYVTNRFGPPIKPAPTTWVARPDGPDPIVGCAESSPTPLVSGVRAGLCYAPNGAQLPCDGKAVTVNATKIMPGGMLSLSANGTEPHSGIVWTTLPIQTHETGEDRDRVFAFDAETLQLLWFTSVPRLAKFVPPMVADGKLFVPTQITCVHGEKGCAASSELRIYALAGLGEAREGYGTRDSCKLVTVDGVALCAESVQTAKNGLDRILTTNLARATSGGFAVETVNAFHVLREAHAGAGLLYECWDAAHARHLYTRDAACGALGAANRTGAVGRVAVTQLPGTVHLVHLSRGGSANDHVYVTSDSDVAIAESLGFTNQGTVGWVWPDASRPQHHAVGNLDHYYTWNVEWAVSYPYQPAEMSWFYLHSVPAPNVVPFYECVNPANVPGGAHHFYTTSYDCEGLGNAARTMELGSIATVALPGTVALQRWNIPSTAAHYYTTSPQPPPGSGYVYEGVAGYVWTAP